MQEIHSKGISHRDLKSENILVDFKFNMKSLISGLLDIFITCLIQQELLDKEHLKSTHYSLIKPTMVTRLMCLT